MAAVDASAAGSNGRDVNDSSPASFEHVRHSKLGDDEGTPKVDVDGVIPLLDIDLKDVTGPLAITRIHNENIRMLAMLLLYFVKESLKVPFFADIALVR